MCKLPFKYIHVWSSIYPLHCICISNVLFVARTKRQQNRRGRGVYCSRIHWQALTCIDLEFCIGLVVWELQQMYCHLGSGKSPENPRYTTYGEVLNKPIKAGQFGWMRQLPTNLSLPSTRPYPASVPEKPGHSVSPCKSTVAILHAVNSHDFEHDLAPGGGRHIFWVTVSHNTPKHVILGAMRACPPKKAHLLDSVISCRSLYSEGVTAC